MKKIAILGANKASLPFYRQARALGYYIVGIAYEEGAICKPFCDKFYPINFSNREQVLAVCQQEQVDGIISFTHLNLRRSGDGVDG